jgi:hypothetical protein
MKTTPTTKPSRHLALFTAIIMALTLWTAMPLTASADTTGTTDTQLNYSISEITNEATITGYAGNATTLTTVEIPATVGDGAQVTSMLPGAFNGCAALSSITLAAGQENFSVDGDVLFNADKTILIRYPRGKAGDFYQVPPTVETINGHAFYGCTLTSVNIPVSVTTIVIGGASTLFSMCTALTHITVAADNPNYSSDAKGVLFNKDKTTLISYPRGKADKTYKIPDSVTEIGIDAFSYCPSLETIEIPDSATTIGTVAFDNCTSLSSITLPDGLTNISTALFRSTNLGSITIPDSVESIGSTAFQDCASLTSVKIQEGVTSIDSSAFTRCTELESVTIPASVTSISNSVFNGCSKLAEVTMLRNGNMNTLAESVFINTSSPLKIWCYDANTAVKTYVSSYSKTLALMINSIKISEELSMDVNDNDTEKLTIAYAPESHSETDADAPTVEWSSSNEDVAKVDEDGAVTAGAVSGTALITATVTPHSGIPLTATCEVTVAPESNEAPTYGLTVNNGKFVGNGPFTQDSTVTVIANDPPFGQIFAGWTDGNGSGESFTDASKPTTVFTMPTGAATVTANYKSVYAVTVANGTDGDAGPYAAGDTVTITANAAENGKVFDKWTAADSSVIFANASSATTSFTMPAKAVTVTANYKDAPAPPAPPAPTTYAVTVAGGSGSGSYEENATVTISANAPEDGKVFDIWTSSDVSFANASSATTSFTMPANAVTVTANYKDDPNSGGDDDPDNPDGPDNPPATDSDWVYENGAWKFFIDGVTQTGWLYDDDAWYYLNADGIMQTGWIYDTDYKAWFYFSGNGAMKTGWVKDNGNWYYLAGNGAMVAAKWFHDIDDSWYYLSGNGKMLTGKQNVGGKAYTFKANGVWVG